MEITTGLNREELPAAAALVSRLQADPRHFIGYLDEEGAALEAQLPDLEPLGLAGIVTAREGGRIIGLLGADWDLDPARVWWHGPLVDDEAVTAAGEAEEGAGDASDDGPVTWGAIADQLYAAASDLLPDAVTEEELFLDVRGEAAAAFARRHGFRREVASAVLTRSLDDVSNVEAAGDTGVEISRLGATDRDRVATLHDRLFPSAHVPGLRLAEGERRWVLVARRADGAPPAGYVAVEQQGDGQGYLDFLGVVPEQRGGGVGTALVAAACRHVRERGSRQVHLTVREDNEAARRLYDGLGFIEERIAVPWRRSRDPRPGT